LSVRNNSQILSTISKYICTQHFYLQRFLSSVAQTGLDDLHAMTKLLTSLTLRNALLTCAMHHSKQIYTHPD